MSSSSGPRSVNNHLIFRVADIISAYVMNNPVPAAGLPILIENVHRTVAGLTNGSALASTPGDQAGEVQKVTPAQICKSVTPDAIISFIDGKAYKTMKRHLGTHGLDPRSYRERYGLPSDYPMIAPNYAAQRSALAKSIGLGRPGSMTRLDESVGSTPQAAKPRKAA